MTGIAHELREDWHAFPSRGWLWVIVVQFGFCNAVFTTAPTGCLGRSSLSGALVGPRAWGVILADRAVGSMLGGGNASLAAATPPARRGLAVPVLALPLLTWRFRWPPK